MMRPTFFPFKIPSKHIRPSREKSPFRSLSLSSLSVWFTRRSEDDEKALSISLLSGGIRGFARAYLGSSLLYSHYNPIRRPPRFYKSRDKSLLLVHPTPRASKLARRSFIFLSLKSEGERERERGREGEKKTRSRALSRLEKGELVDRRARNAEERCKARPSLSDGRTDGASDSQYYTRLRRGMRASFALARCGSLSLSLSRERGDIRRKRGLCVERVATGCVRARASER